jgi:hypothetical protein
MYFFKDQWAATSAAAILAVHVGLAVVSLPQQAVTIDEYGHLPAGVSHWQKRTFFVYSVNPPLVKMWAALPVLAAEPEMIYEADFRPVAGQRYEWILGRRFLQANRERYFQLFFLGRYPMVVLSVLGGWFVFLWSRALYGPVAGVVATSLWAMCPNVLGYSQIITPDMGAAAAMLIACYGYWRWLQRPMWTRAGIAGALLGVAQLTKFTALVLYPVWLILWLTCRTSLLGEYHQRVSDRENGQPRKSRVPQSRQPIQFLAIIAISILVLNAGYAFEGSFRGLGEFEFVSEMLTASRVRPTGIYRDEQGVAIKRYEAIKENRFKDTWLEHVPVPLPQHYVQGIDFQKRDFEGHTFFSYLRGEIRRGGWWYYYLYGLGVKLPVGTLALALFALVLSLAGPRFRGGARDELVVLLPAASVLILVSSQTGFNHHVRYVLPAIPFLFISLSRVGKLFHAHTSLGAGARETATLGSLCRWRSRSLAAVVALCLLWNATAVARIHPHYLSYFNEFAGGPNNGARHLINSNLDWGQDLLFLKEWVDRNPQARPLGVAYFNFVDADLANIDFHLPPFGPTDLFEEEAWNLGPKPGWYAVSANFVYGMTFGASDGRGQRALVPEFAYTYFQHFEPVAKAGYSIFIYHISLEEANRVRHTLGLPPLPP